MNLKELFVSMLRIGCIGFGGGSTLIPVLHKTYVEEKGVLSEEEFEEDVMLASITSGALTVKLAGEIGRRIAGWKGMLVSALAMALPGAVLTSVFLSVLANLSEGWMQQLEFLTLGVLAYITCMLTDYVYKTVTVADAQGNLWQSVLITIGVFGFTCGKNLYRLLEIPSAPFFSLSTLDIFLMAFFVVLFNGDKKRKVRVVLSLLLCVGYVLCAGERKVLSNEHIFMAIKLAMLFLALCGLLAQKKGLSFWSLEWKAMAVEIGVMLSAVFLFLIPAVFVSTEVWLYTGRGMLSTVISFGGGDAYLTVADGLFVQTGMITEDVFYGSVVPLVNILPGSVLCKVLSGIGYMIGFLQTGSMVAGCVMAAVGLACSFAASCGMVSVAGYLYKSFGELSMFQCLKQWIRPIVSGLMLNVILSLVYQSRQTGVVEGMGWACVFIMFIAYAINMILFYRKKRSSAILLISAIVVTMVLCNNGVYWLG